VALSLPCLSYVTVSAVSISKRCTVYILDKISASPVISVLVVCRTMEHGPGGSGVALPIVCPSTLARHPCQAPVPDTSTNSMRSPHEQSVHASSPAFYVGLPSLMH
jgi:hypothetical protein